MISVNSLTLRTIRRYFHLFFTVNIRQRLWLQNLTWFLQICTFVSQRTQGNKRSPLELNWHSTLRYSESLLRRAENQVEGIVFLLLWMNNFCIVFTTNISFDPHGCPIGKSDGSWDSLKFSDFSSLHTGSRARTWIQMFSNFGMIKNKHLVFVPGFFHLSF